MKSRYTFVAILALGSVGIQGMDDSWRKQWADMSAALKNAPHIDTKASADTAGRNISHLHMGEAAGVPNRNVATDVQKRFDSLLNPAGPSFLVQGIQVALTVTLSLAPIFGPLVIKRYFAKKEEIEREANYETFIEQNILINLESEIAKLMHDMPKIQKEFEFLTDPKEKDRLRKLLKDGHETLQRKITKHKALTEKYKRNQELRYADDIHKAATPQEPAA